MGNIPAGGEHGFEHRVSVHTSDTALDDTIYQLDEPSVNDVLFELRLPHESTIQIVGVTRADHRPTETQFGCTYHYLPVLPYKNKGRSGIATDMALQAANRTALGHLVDIVDFHKGETKRRGEWKEHTRKTNRIFRIGATLGIGAVWLSNTYLIGQATDMTDEIVTMRDLGGFFSWSGLTSLATYSLYKYGSALNKRLSDIDKKYQDHRSEKVNEMAGRYSLVRAVEQ